MNFIVLGGHTGIMSPQFTQGPAIGREATKPWDKAMSYPAIMGITHIKGKNIGYLPADMTTT